MLEKIFKLSRNGTDVKTEVFAGVTTFMAMAYILGVNPNILSGADMDWGALFTATALAAAFSTFVMAFYANQPYALAPGMIFNSFFVFIILGKLGHSLQFAFTATLLAGALFMLLAMTRVGCALFAAIPASLKNAVSVGLGLFIAFIGLQSAGIVVHSPGTLITLGSISNPTAIVALLGTIFITLLLSLRIKSALLIGMIITTIASIVVGITSVPSSIIRVPHSIEPIFLQFDFNLIDYNMIVVVFLLLIVHAMDSVGTVTGLTNCRFGTPDEKEPQPREEAAGEETTGDETTREKTAGEDPTPPRARQVLVTNAAAAMTGAVLGTSTVTTFVESASGMALGGRTGLTAFTTGVLFLLSLFFVPLFSIVPAAATAPILIVVGFLMMRPIVKINFENYNETLPAFLTVIMMPLTFSIVNGIMFGLFAFVLLKFFSGKTQDIPFFTWVVAAFLLIRFAIDI